MKQPSFPTDEEHRAYDLGRIAGLKHWQRTGIQLFDALENLISTLYADGPRGKDFDRAERALHSFCKRIGQRKYGYWEGEINFKG